VQKTTKRASGQLRQQRPCLAVKAGCFWTDKLKELEWRHHIPETGEGQSFSLPITPRLERAIVPPAGRTSPLSKRSRLSALTTVPFRKGTCALRRADNLVSTRSRLSELTTVVLKGHLCPPPGGQVRFLNDHEFTPKLMVFEFDGMHQNVAHNFETCLF
jgi:hypothetical protein